MRGIHAFCPQSGAPLSKERHQPGTFPTKTPVRAPEPGEDEGPPMTPLSKGADFSSCGALQSHFRRLFERFNERDDQFERRGAMAIKALKQVGDDDDTPELHDDYVWIALAERLHRRYDYSRRDLDWMFACVEVCCPSCFSMLKWQKRPDGRVLGRCSEHCQGVQVYVTYRIREIIRSGYNRAFTRGSNEDAIGELLVLQAPETKSESDGERARA